MYRVILKHAAILTASVFLAPSANAVEVYLFKGAGDFSFVSDNLHFSRGLNKIADTLNQEGIHAEVRRFGAVEDALSTIRERKPKSVAFIGHSMGALASMAMARNLKGEGIDIVYMGLIDIPGPVGVAGENVDWVENYYSINPVYGKLTNVRAHPNAKNIHVGGYIHNRMDDSPEVQNGMLSAIRQIHASEINELPVEQPDLLFVEAPKEVDPQLTATTPVQAGVASQTLQSQAQVIDPEYKYIPPTPDVATTQAVVVEPYQLPSVDVGYGNQPTPQSQDPLIVNQDVAATVNNSQGVDPVTTSSIAKPSLAQRGRNLLKRAGNFVRNLKNRRSERAEAFAPQAQ